MLSSVREQPCPPPNEVIISEKWIDEQPNRRQTIKLVAIKIPISYNFKTTQG